jgi:hypothetical protein
MIVANYDSVLNESDYKDSIPSERVAFSANENLEKFKMAVKFLRSLRDANVIDDKQFENLVSHFSAIFLADEFEKTTAPGKKDCARIRFFDDDATFFRFPSAIIRKNRKRTHL